MQTFLPYPSFEKSAQSLDYRRLGRQAQEALQIIETLEGNRAGWKNHPATLMWKGYTPALCEYAIAMRKEWIKRGYQDTTLPKLLKWKDVLGDPLKYPSWLGDEKIHASMRARLLRKDPEFYAPLFPDTDPQLEPIWPEPDIK